MMDYHKHYPSRSTSTYPPHTLSTPAHGPRFPPPLPSAPPGPPSVSVAVAVAGAPPPQPPAPPPSGPSSLSGSPWTPYSQSHRPLRPSNGPVDQSQLDMPRSAPPSAAYNHHPPPDGTPAVTLYSAENGYAPLRRGDSVYHVSPANHSSRKRPHREDVFQGASPRHDANSGPRYRSDRERLAVHREGELFVFPSSLCTCWWILLPSLRLPSVVLLPAWTARIERNLSQSLGWPIRGPRSAGRYAQRGRADAAPVGGSAPGAQSSARPKPTALVVHHGLAPSVPLGSSLSSLSVSPLPPPHLSLS